MAENEILDVGNPRRYRKWRNALVDPTQSPEQVADCLSDDFLGVTRDCLRSEPLYRVLRACDGNQAALQAVVASCRNRDLAELVERAFRLSVFKDPAALADKVACMLVDQLQDQTRLYAFRHVEGLDRQRLDAIESATSDRLSACKPHITALLLASLTDEKLPRRPRRNRPAPSARALSESSLLQPSL